MRKQVLAATICAVVMSMVTTFSQSGAPPTVGTFISAEEIETVVKAPGGAADREIKIVDVGRHNLGVAVLRRAAMKAGGPISGINHTKMTEVYYVVSGEGTMVMGTDVTNVRPVPADNEIVTVAVGASNNATFVKAAQTRRIKAGDVVIVPIGGLSRLLRDSRPYRIRSDSAGSR